MNYTFESVDTTNGILIKNLSLNIGSSFLLKETEFKISNGHNYGLVAPNGKGKTTLMKFINDNIQFKDNRKVHMVKQEDESRSLYTIHEAVVSAHKDYMRYKSEEMRILSLIETDSKIETEIDPTQQLEDLYEWANKYDLDSVERQAHQILFGLGFVDKESHKKKISQFSGGWRMRISIAKALLMKPHVLLLDEPTNHLDLDAVIWLGNYLQQWNKFKNTTKNILILISHDYNFMDDIVDKMIRIDDGQLKYYTGNQTHMLKKIKIEQKQELVKWGKEKKKFKSKKDKKKNQPKIPYSVDFKFKINIRKDNYVKADNVGFGYTEKNLLSNVDLTIASMDRIALVGKNGVGKSTFLNILCETLKPTSGNVEKRCGKIGKYSQHFEDILNNSMTPIQFIESIYPEWSITDVRKHLSAYNLNKEIHKIPIGQCSGGQKARIALSTLSESDILVLDEPTNHLDIETIEGLTEALVEFKGGLLVVSHDIRFIDELECDIYICSNGCIEKFEGDIYNYQKRVIDEFDAIHVKK